MSRMPNSSTPGVQDSVWIASWQRVARRIRVPLGFLTALIYLFDLWRQAPCPSEEVCNTKAPCASSA